MKFFYFLFSHFPVLEIKSWHTLTRQPLLTNLQDTDFFQSKITSNSQKWLTYNLSPQYPYIFWQTGNKNNQSYQGEVVISVDPSPNSYI